MLSHLPFLEHIARCIHQSWSFPFPVYAIFKHLNFDCVNAALCDHYCPIHTSCHTFSYASPLCLILVATTSSAPPNLYPILKYTIYMYDIHVIASLQALVCQG